MQLPRCAFWQPFPSYGNSGGVLVAGFVQPLDALLELDRYPAAGVDVERVAGSILKRTVVRPETDPFVPPAASDELARRLNARVQVQPGSWTLHGRRCGHELPGRPAGLRRHRCLAWSIVFALALTVVSLALIAFAPFGVALVALLSGATGTGLTGAGMTGAGSCCWTGCCPAVAASDWACFTATACAWVRSALTAAITVAILRWRSTESSPLPAPSSRSA